MHLSPLELRQLHAIFAAILPSGQPGLALGAREVDMEAYVQRFLATLPLRTALGLRLGLMALAASPVWYARRGVSLASLPEAEATALLERLLGSPIWLLRQLVFLFREVACMAYGSDPQVQRALDSLVRPVAQTQDGGVA